MFRHPISQNAEYRFALVAAPASRIVRVSGSALRVRRYGGFMMQASIGMCALTLTDRHRQRRGDRKSSRMTAACTRMCRSLHQVSTSLRFCSYASASSVSASTAVR